MSKDVVVVLESLGEHNRQLLDEGGRVANLLGGSLTALLAEPSTHGSNAWVQAVKKFLEDRPFRLLLFAHTDRGSELAPMIAHALDTSAVLDCFDIRFRNGNLHYARHVYCGQFEQEVSFAEPPEIATLNPESFETCNEVSANTTHLKVPEDPDPKRTIAKIAPDYQTVDIRYAKRILDIGAGCDQPDLLKLAEELAALLEASVGTTRLVVDGGHISKGRMIGQTGKTVSPELCLTLGVSGSPHHVAGIRKAAKIFAVNSDARAPIFGAADAAFVADLKSLLPKLINRIKLYRDNDLT